MAALRAPGDGVRGPSGPAPKAPAQSGKDDAGAARHA